VTSTKRFALKKPGFVDHDDSGYCSLFKAGGTADRADPAQERAVVRKGNFKALAESIEREQARRGTL
jgi:hypothetical protein